MLNKLIRYFIVFLCVCCLFSLVTDGRCEEEYVESIDYGTLMVTASVLNGRRLPTKNAPVEARFDFGDKITPTGEWSHDKKWVEVKGGETGTVWVRLSYVTEEWGVFTYRNTSTKKVKIRKGPVNGKLVGYLGANKTVDIDQVVLGWGHCKRGWIDMTYLEKDE